LDQPKLCWILACRKYWLIAVSSPVSCFARWRYARRDVPVARVTDIEEARAVCVLLRAAGVQAAPACAAGDAGMLVSVPASQRSSAQPRSVSCAAEHPPAQPSSRFAIGIGPRHPARHAQRPRVARVGSFEFAASCRNPRASELEAGRLVSTAMAHAVQSVTVNHPIGEVFAFLADGANEPAWRPGVTNLGHVADSGTGVGAQYEQTMKGPGGRSIRGDYRITRYDEPTRLDFEVIAGPARPTGRFDLRETASGTTEVTFTLDLKPRRLMVLMTPMINKQVRAEVANIANLPQALGD
jgi:uncharacterized protein YndB with AHSA1/START domain